MIQQKNKGYIHIYYGEGKGKTSNLNGMVLRALGADKKIIYLRFLKNRETSENKVLKQLGIEVQNFYKFSKKFFWEMNEQEKQIFKQETLNGYKVFQESLQNPDLDFIFVDEILGAIENGFIDKTTLVNDLKKRLKHQEVLLSGRYSYEELNDISDLISEIKSEKHYFNKKVEPRFGVEY